MIQEIYIRQPNDPKFNDKLLDISDEYEMLYSKILMILNTKKGEVLGDPSFGVSLEDYLFTFEVSDSEIQSAIFTQIQTYVDEYKLFNLKLDIKRFKGTVRDIILLDFFVDGRKAFGVMVN